MSVRQEGDLLNRSDPQMCRAFIETTKWQANAIHDVLRPLEKWLDPLQVINLTCGNPSMRQADETHTKESRKRHTEFISPAISIMVFLLDRCGTSKTDSQLPFRNPAWTFHHRVELTNRNTPDTIAAKQEFYELDRDLPLFSICQVYYGNERLRINLSVCKYSAMIEFYRLVSATEMESSKPGFGCFTLYSQAGMEIQLALKCIPQVKPRVLDSICLHFKIRNIRNIVSATNCNVTQISYNTYLVRDPDGNPVILHEMESLNIQRQLSTKYSEEIQTISKSSFKHGSRKANDSISSRSMSDGPDSGRYSDSDLCSSDKHATTLAYHRFETDSFYGKRLNIEDIKGSDDVLHTSVIHNLKPVAAPSKESDKKRFHLLSYV